MGEHYFPKQYNPFVNILFLEHTVTLVCGNFYSYLNIVLYNSLTEKFSNDATNVTKQRTYNGRALAHYWTNSSTTLLHQIAAIYACAAIDNSRAALA